MNFVVMGFIKNYFSHESKLKQVLCADDNQRIHFESVFTTEIISQNELLAGDLKSFSQGLF